MGTTLELGIDRPGLDYTGFDLPEARPELCRVACFNDPTRCKSFTYVKPGVGGSSRAKCWLKNGIPDPVLNTNTDSGTTQTQATMGYFSGQAEINVDRPGMDYEVRVLTEARPELCREACRTDSRTCRAFAYVRPSKSNPKPQCRLKNGIPAAVSSPWTDAGINSDE
ncbi:PAN domain-containing protein [Archangium sp.]|uniref:PAN domain-containing protein n=1 Tax=Archangium sp. TaxID=1872627 RepID=UPI002D226A4B|nr:PAN domain-containing protein [Archangium sp.]HYO54147.1 PAN domain-containing protein [Archangium sp.]